MFKNYLITVYRNLLRFRLDSILNISGLVIGLTAALLIFLFVRHETSYDDFWQDSERLYRLETKWVLQGREDIKIVTSPGPLKQALSNYFPNEIETAARLLTRNPVVFVGEKSYADQITFADPEILDIFDFEVVSGDARAALSGNANIILSETLARKYFGNTNPINQVLTIDNRFLKRDYRVLAIMRDLPHNTHLELQALIQIDENDYVDGNGSWMFSTWNAAPNHTYVKLNEGYTIENIHDRIDEFTDATLTVSRGKPSDVNKFIPLTVPDIHLYSEGASAMKPSGDHAIVNAFAAIALLIVVVATINYINLATARAGQRAKEIAMRKVLGANRRHLLVQYLGESMLIVALSIAFAVVCVQLALPFFNQALELDLVLELDNPSILAYLLVTLVVVAGLSGIYPALVLTSYLPSNALRANQSTKTGDSVRARNVLVVFQTAVTIMLIVATAVVYAQLTFFNRLDRGFEPDQLLVVEGMTGTDVVDKQTALRDELQRLPDVQSASLSYEAPTRYSENNTRLYFPGQSEQQSHPVGLTRVDTKYLDALKIPLLAGRFYQRDMALDAVPSMDDLQDGAVLQGNIVINRRAVEALGYDSPQQAIGKIVEQRDSLDDGGETRTQFTIIGVIGDANLHTAKKPVRPEIYELNSFYNHMLIRYSGDATQVLEQVKAVWFNVAPTTPFKFFYVDQALAEEFNAELSQANIFFGFALLTLVIGCLGLYGLAAFVTECRRREMGIRKVFGAGIIDVLGLVLGQFSRLVIVANLIAWPVTYLLMNNWLEQYPFRISAAWIMAFCIGAGVLASCIVTLTVGSQAWDVARSNPIRAIHHE